MVFKEGRFCFSGGIGMFGDVFDCYDRGALVVFSGFRLEMLFNMYRIVFFIKNCLFLYVISVEYEKFWRRYVREDVKDFRYIVKRKNKCRIIYLILYY